MISAGQRTKRVLLEHPTITPDGAGGYTEVFVPLDPPEVFAHIDRVPSPDAERGAGGGVIATAGHVIEIAWHPQVSVYTRITYGARRFSVTSVRDPDEARRELVLNAQEVLP